MAWFKKYYGLPGQPYPLNVRAPFLPDTSQCLLNVELLLDRPFLDRNNLYQRVRKCIRNK